MARVGKKSLHSDWLGEHERDWDLMLCPYEPIDASVTADCLLAESIAGPKWAGLLQLLRTWDGWRAYDYVWLPDDDVAVDKATISRMFEVARALKLDLFAPALDERSSYAHYSTMRNPNFYVRRVGFVEIMVPGFSTAALDRLLPTLAHSATGWGWGLDSVWPKLLDYENVAIIDGTPVLHSRPVGELRDGDLRRRLHEEAAAVTRHFDCRPVHTTFSAFGPDLRPLVLSPEALLAELVDGWRYLHRNDHPRILAWIAKNQEPPGGWAAYPVGGTPSTTAGSRSLSLL